MSWFAFIRAYNSFPPQVPPPPPAPPLDNAGLLAKIECPVCLEATIELCSTICGTCLRICASISVTQWISFRGRSSILQKVHHWRCENPVEVPGLPFQADSKIISPCVQLSACLDHARSSIRQTTREWVWFQPRARFFSRGAKHCPSESTKMHHRPYSKILHELQLIPIIDSVQVWRVWGGRPLLKSGAALVVLNHEAVSPVRKAAKQYMERALARQ